MTNDEIKTFVDENEEEMEQILREYTMKKRWEGFLYGTVITIVVFVYCEVFLK